MGEEPFDVLLIGLGPVGGIYAYILEKSLRCRVTAIARSLHGTIQAHGITIQSKKFGEISNWKPYRVTATAQAAADRKYRFIICCFKCLPDVQPTSAILEPFLASYTQKSADTTDSNKPPTVVLIQNGIGIEQPLAEAFPNIHIISCVAWIGANLLMSPLTSENSTPNQNSQPPPQSVLIEHGLMEKLVFGLYEGEGFATKYGGDPNDLNPGLCGSFVDGLLSQDRLPLQGEAREEKRSQGKAEVDVLASVLRQGGGDAEVVEYIQPARWAKNLWNGAFSTMCTLSRTPVSSLMAPEVLPYTLPVVRRTMLEILYVARGLGYRESELPAQSVDDAIQVTIQNYQIKHSPPTGNGRIPSRSDSKEAQPRPDMSSDAQDTAVFEDDDEEELDADSDADKNTHKTFKPSMLMDLENGRPMELEPIIGAVLDRARSKAIETPRLDLIYSALKVLQEQAVNAHAAKLATQEQEKHLHSWAMRKPSVGGSGTSDSRLAWLSEVRRRTMLGEKESTPSPLSAANAPLTIPLTDGKVTGKPLNS